MLATRVMPGPLPDRSTTPWLPRWAAASLGVYLVLSVLHSLVGRQLHFIPLYLIPVLLASRGGSGPGLAMMVASLVSGAATEMLVLPTAAPLALIADMTLFAGLGGVIVTRTALHNRLLEQYRQESAATRELLRFARHTGDPTALPVLLRAVADVGSRLLRADYGATFLWEPRSKQFRAGGQSAAGEQQGVRLSDLVWPAAGSPIVAQLLRQRSAMVVDDTSGRTEWARLVSGLPVARVLLVPTVSWGRVLGCLLFGRDKHAPPFTENERRLAEAMAEQVATSLEHAEAFQAIERQADQIRQLNLDLERRNAQLRELEQLRNDLVHMIVHDMRSPLASLISSMRWVEKSAGATLPAPLAEAHAVGRRSAEELLGMVNDLLDVARLEEGKLDLERTVETVADLTAAALEQTRYLANERRLLMETRLPSRLVPVWVDREKIVRVLVNLVSNAIKFTPIAGRIEVSAAPAAEGWIAVTVQDNGEGIPVEFHEHIFAKFGQVGTRKGGRKMSTGLGLAYCKLAVEAHGGTITVESRPGEGARFTFTLPEARVAVGSGGAARAA